VPQEYGHVVDHLVVVVVLLRAGRLLVGHLASTRCGPSICGIIFGLIGTSTSTAGATQPGALDSVKPVYLHIRAPASAKTNCLPYISRPHCIG